MAIIVIMAQIGCFVPARAAVIPIRKRILSRIGTNDDMENNLSSFSMEMKEVSYILEHANEDSFIIIDELGRSSSNIDGNGLI
jgi:DNA mismatch repair ATPase MutS